MTGVMTTKEIELLEKLRANFADSEKDHINQIIAQAQARARAAAEKGARERMRQYYVHPDIERACALVVWSKLA